jgi:hypothetical protein
MEVTKMTNESSPETQKQELTNPTTPTTPETPTKPTTTLEILSTQVHLLDMQLALIVLHESEKVMRQEIVETKDYLAKLTETQT